MFWFKKNKCIRVKGTSNNILCNKLKSNLFYQCCKLRIRGNNNIVSIDDTNTFEKSEIIIHGNNNSVTIGKASGGILHIEILADNCLIEIGDKSGFTGAQICLRDNNSQVSFGQDCIVAKDTRFYCTDFHSIVEMDTKKPINQGHSIVIGNHVWIGEGVKVLKNTKIADNIIVGISSVVCKDLEESYAAYAGAPAILRKKNIGWQRDKFDVAISKYEGNKND